MTLRVRKYLNEMVPQLSVLTVGALVVAGVCWALSAFNPAWMIFCQLMLIIGLIWGSVCAIYALVRRLLPHE